MTFQKCPKTHTTQNPEGGLVTWHGPLHMSQKQCSKKQHTTPRHFSKVKNIVTCTIISPISESNSCFSLLFPMQTDPTWINWIWNTLGRKAVRRHQGSHRRSMCKTWSLHGGKLLTGGCSAGQTETHCNRSQVCSVKTWRRWGDSLEMSQHTPKSHQSMSFRQENEWPVSVGSCHTLS